MFSNYRQLSKLVVIPEIISGTVGVLGNAVANLFPDWMKWPSLALFFFFTLLLIIFKVKEVQSSEQPITRPSQPTEYLHSAALQKTSRLSSSIVHQTAPISSKSAITQTMEAPPLIIDEKEMQATINEPLPTLTPRQATPSSKEKLATLRSISTEVRYSRQLPERPKKLCWSPDGTYLAALFHEQSPQLFSEQDIISLPDWEAVQELCWSPDGHTLAISAQGTIHFWNRDRGEESISLRNKISNSPIYGLDWSSQKKLAVGVGNEIQIFAPFKQDVTPICSTQLARCDNISMLRWSPNGAWLVARATNDGASLFFCWNNEASTYYQLPFQRGVSCIAWQPESYLLAIAFSNLQVAIWDVSRQQQVSILGKLPVAPHSMSIAQDHTLTIASRADELLTGHLGHPFPTAKYTGHWIAEWSPNGREFATLDATTKTTVCVCSPLSSLSDHSQGVRQA